jgi:endonuclease-8
VPEGDTIHRAAARLDASLTGRSVTRVGGTHRSVIRHGRRIEGRTVTGVTAAGKHLLVGFDNGWMLRTHLGMSGAWHLYESGERWRRSPGAARVVLETGEARAVCFAAPTVQIAPRHLVEEAIAHLGPDAATDGFDAMEASRRAAERAPETPVCDVLTDQSVLAGVGNVFKSEVLFAERIYPLTPIGRLDADRLGGLFDRAGRMVRANRAARRRVTTGVDRAGRRLWVYDRAGRPCRRCGTTIESAWVGSPPRVTAWCPSCQPVVTA